MVPLVVLTSARILDRDRCGISFGIVHAEQPAHWRVRSRGSTVKWSSRRERGFRIEAFFLLIEDDQVIHLDRRVGRYQLSPTFIQSQSSADLQPARPYSRS